MYDIYIPVAYSLIIIIIIISMLSMQYSFIRRHASNRKPCLCIHSRQVEATIIRRRWLK
jgi:hypothetical protein